MLAAIMTQVSRVYAFSVDSAYILWILEFLPVAIQLAILMYNGYTPVASFSRCLAKNLIAVSIDYVEIFKT